MYGCRLNFVGNVLHCLMTKERVGFDTNQEECATLLVQFEVKFSEFQAMAGGEMNQGLMKKNQL